MKSKDAIAALKDGKRIVRTPSDSPVDLCDHLTDSPPKSGFYQMCHNDIVVHLVSDAPCAATVANMWELEQFELLLSPSYLNFVEHDA